MAMSVSEIVNLVNQEIAKKKRNDDETPQNINTGTLYGGQHVNNVVVNGDHIPGNKNGKKNKK